MPSLAWAVAALKAAIDPVRVECVPSLGLGWGGLEGRRYVMLAVLWMFSHKSFPCLALEKAPLPHAGMEPLFQEYRCLHSLPGENRKRVRLSVGKNRIREM